MADIPTAHTTAFWQAACAADEEVFRLWHLLEVLTRETDPDDHALVTRRTNAALAVSRRLAELLARLEEARE